MSCYVSTYHACFSAVLVAKSVYPWTCLFYCQRCESTFNFTICLADRLTLISPTFMTLTTLNKIVIAVLKGRGRPCRFLLTE